MLSRSDVKQPSRAKVIVAFASVYLIWGSTFLAIRYAIETMPPFLMAGARFLLAGAALYIWARLRGAERPNLSNWGAATIVGGLLLLGGNGSVVWSEQHVASGLVALLVTTIPLWMVLLESLRSRRRPGKQVIGGLILGLAGLVLLIDPAKLMGNGQIDLVSAIVLVFGSFCWAAGSLYARHAQLPASPLLTTALEMLTGGSLLLLAGLATGQWSRIEFSEMSVRSLLSLGYLSVFGSIIAFTAYSWLLRVSTPARVSTYAYVNPVIAVFLGWLLGGEPLTARTLLAAAIIVTAVVLINTYGARSGARTAETAMSASIAKRLERFSIFLPQRSQSSQREN